MQCPRFRSEEAEDDSCHCLRINVDDEWDESVCPATTHEENCACSYAQRAALLQPRRDDRGMHSASALSPLTYARLFPPWHTLLLLTIVLSAPLGVIAPLLPSPPPSPPPSQDDGGSDDDDTNSDLTPARFYVGFQLRHSNDSDNNGGGKGNGGVRRRRRLVELLPSLAAAASARFRGAPAPRRLAEGDASVTAHAWTAVIVTSVAKLFVVHMDNITVITAHQDMELGMVRACTASQVVHSHTRTRSMRTKPALHTREELLYSPPFLLLPLALIIIFCQPLRSILSFAGQDRAWN